jgi:hypothetical protein
MMVKESQELFIHEVHEEHEVFWGNPFVLVALAPVWGGSFSRQKGRAVNGFMRCPSTTGFTAPLENAGQERSALRSGRYL